MPVAPSVASVVAARWGVAPGATGSACQRWARTVHVRQVPVLLSFMVENFQNMPSNTHCFHDMPFNSCYFQNTSSEHEFSLFRATPSLESVASSSSILPEPPSSVRHHPRRRPSVASIIVVHRLRPRPCQLRSAEEHKEWALLHLLRRCGGQGGCGWVTSWHRWRRWWWSCWTRTKVWTPKWRDDCDGFLKMMLLDGCFLC